MARQRDKIKKFAGIIVVVTGICMLTIVNPAFTEEKGPGEQDLGIAIYPDMQFTGYTPLKDRVAAARYCSSSSPSAIIKLYKEKYKGAMEIQEGSPEGVRHKIILDMKSIENWRNSRKYIEIYSNIKKPDCKTVINITVPEHLVKTMEMLAKKGAEESAKRKSIGLGGYINTVNFSGGPTLILWPFKNLALQASYGMGTFTSFEARGFYRFDLSESFNPYLGAGYLHVEKDVTAIGVNTNIKGNSFTVFGGIELPIYKSLFAYVDIAGTPMKIETDVTSGSRSAKVTVSYSPVTIGMGLVFYIF